MRACKKTFNSYSMNGVLHSVLWIHPVWYSELFVFKVMLSSVLLHEAFHSGPLMGLSSYTCMQSECVCLSWFNSPHRADLRCWFCLRLRTKTHMVLPLLPWKAVESQFVLSWTAQCRHFQWNEQDHTFTHVRCQHTPTPQHLILTNFLLNVVLSSSHLFWRMCWKRLAILGPTQEASLINVK